jgi:hypothetical protein
MKKFADLNNEEIIVVYEKFKDYFEEINDKLKKNILHEKRESAIRVHYLSNEEVDQFKNTNYYKCVESIINKLHPIVDIIKDAAPEIAENLSEDGK